MHAPSFVIDRRFCGPPRSGNGGYACGALAAPIAGDARVRLMAPPPLDVAIALEPAHDGAFEATYAGVTLGRAVPAPLELEAPPCPAMDDVLAAVPRYVGFAHHVYPGCFVCGPERAEGDGLRVFPGPLADGSAVASTWTPDASLADAEGRVDPIFQWSALDCPGGFAFAAAGGRAILLGELHAQIRGPVHAGQRYIVIGWEMAHRGVKHTVGSALYDESGTCLGLARGIWFEVDEVPLPPGVS